MLKKELKASIGNRREDGMISITSKFYKIPRPFTYRSIIETILDSGDGRRISHLLSVLDRFDCKVKDLLPVREKKEYIKLRED